MTTRPHIAHSLRVLLIVITHHNIVKCKPIRWADANASLSANIVLVAAMKKAIDCKTHDNVFLGITITISLLM